MKTYLAVVNKEKDSAFGLWFPDLPGCFSASDEEDDLVFNALEAIHLWADDQTLPNPSSKVDLLDRKDVKDALADGAFLFAIPVIEADTKVVRANVTFERGMLRAIDVAARSLGLSRSAFLASAAREKIEMRH